MEILALAGYLLFGALAFGLRSVIQLRRTGSTGFRGVSGRPGSLAWFGGVLFPVAIAVAVAAPMLAASGWLAPFAALDRPLVHALGGLLYAAGIAGTLWAQLAMGDSWRIGVDEDERTALVTRGPFGRVRNPIFTCMVAAVTGLGLLTPNAVALLAPVLLTLAVEIHVRNVEEPYLARTHGPAYARYRARTGRFVPGVGR
jgi:protein-S-isoprenylcysteine O-methyltransferase Ste14